MSAPTLPVTTAAAEQPEVRPDLRTRDMGGSADTITCGTAIADAI